MLTKYPIITDQIELAELRVILTEFEKVQSRQVKGDVVEFGCYAGTTSLFLARMISPERHLHVYDSFEGLPEKSAADESPAGMQFKTGALEVSKRTLVQNFRRAGLELPHIHKGWFVDLGPKDLPTNIAFAFLDGDYYESIRAPLQLLWPLLSPGATVIVDDYQNEALPGASRAVDEWLKTHSARLQVQASLAIIRPALQPELHA